MVWKIVMLSIAIVIGSFIIAGAIVAAQVLSGNLDIDDDIEGQARGDSGENPAPIPDGEIVRIIGDSGRNSYDPNPLEIKVNETVTWVNDDSTVHTATSKDGTFGSEVLFRGESFSYTFDKEGEYSYFCDVHPGMGGTVVVAVAAGGS